MLLWYMEDDRGRCGGDDDVRQPDGFVDVEGLAAPKAIVGEARRTSTVRAAAPTPHTTAVRRVRRDTFGARRCRPFWTHASINSRSSCTALGGRCASDISCVETVVMLRCEAELPPCLMDGPRRPLLIPADGLSRTPPPVVKEASSDTEVSRLSLKGRPRTTPVGPEIA